GLSAANCRFFSRELKVNPTVLIDRMRTEFGSKERRQRSLTEAHRAVASVPASSLSRPWPSEVDLLIQDGKHAETRHPNRDPRCGYLALPRWHRHLHIGVL